MCWLCCKENSKKVIGYCANDALCIGKRQTGEVKFWSTSKWGVDCNFYKPNFCPE